MATRGEAKAALWEASDKDDAAKQFIVSFLAKYSVDDVGVPDDALAVGVTGVEAKKTVTEALVDYDAQKAAEKAAQDKEAAAVATATEAANLAAADEFTAYRLAYDTAYTTKYDEEKAKDPK